MAHALWACFRALLADLTAYHLGSQDADGDDHWLLRNSIVGAEPSSTICIRAWDSCTNLDGLRDEIRLRGGPPLRRKATVTHMSG